VDNFADFGKLYDCFARKTLPKLAKLTKKVAKIAPRGYAIFDPEES
jgi:hypothetical protein